ncbi:MAG: hypothetical protein M3P49_00945, partial [Actinomycetota bacterium]|nr:hypothetical protein [Actinomycetota bacterium]
MIESRKAGALLTAVAVLLVLAATSPVSAQEETAGSAQYPEEVGPVPTQYGASDAQYEPPAAQTPQPAPDVLNPPAGTGDLVNPAAGDAQKTVDTVNHDPDETPESAMVPSDVPESPAPTYDGTPTGEEQPGVADAPQYSPEDGRLLLEDECDPAYEECSDDVTGDLVNPAAGDAQKIEGTLDGSAGAPAPAEEPAYVPGEPSDAPTSGGSEQYPAYGSAAPQEEIAPFPSPPLPELLASVEAPIAPVEESGYAAEPAPEDAA